jgi:hypothetical protein
MIDAMLHILAKKDPSEKPTKKKAKVRRKKPPKRKSPHPLRLQKQWHKRRLLQIQIHNGLSTKCGQLTSGSHVRVRNWIVPKPSAAWSRSG